MILKMNMMPTVRPMEVGTAMGAISVSQGKQHRAGAEKVNDGRTGRELESGEDFSFFLVQFAIFNQVFGQAGTGIGVLQGANHSQYPQSQADPSEDAAEERAAYGQLSEHRSVPER